MRYQTLWHAEHKVPIVDGNYQNPITGEIEQCTRADTFLGPPSVHVMWFNTYENSTFRSIGCTFVASVDEVFVAISEHVRANFYNIISLNATLYAITVICSTARSDVEIGGVVQDMHKYLNRDVAIPEDERAALRDWRDSLATGEIAIPEESRESDPQS